MATVVVETPAIEEEPTLIGFVGWAYAVMGVPQDVLSANSIYFRLAFDESVNIAYIGLRLVKNRSPYRYTSQSPPTPGPPIAGVPPPVRRVQSPSIYAIAVYNLGGHILTEIANDDPDLPPPFNTFWADLRQKLGLNSFSYGLINSAADQGTSAAQMIPDAIANLSLMNLDMMKTPWGRRYLQIAMQWGTLWGIS